MRDELNSKSLFPAHKEHFRTRVTIHKIMKNMHHTRSLELTMHERNPAENALFETAEPAATPGPVPEPRSPAASGFAAFKSGLRCFCCAWRAEALAAGRGGARGGKRQKTKKRNRQTKAKAPKPRISEPA
jgi:hypothetical protein